jgi:acyl CoA:acetate/3-ketoacid CoA transferase alpha subunit
MNTANEYINEKVMPLKDAIERFVFDGAHISIGGFTVNRNPMAAVYEIVRQRKRGLHVYAHSNGQGVDDLIGGGCVERLEIAYAGTGRFAPTCLRFRREVQAGRLKVEDYSNYQMTLRFAAGAMGVPFLPVRSGMGTDIVRHWGFSLRSARRMSACPMRNWSPWTTPSATGAMLPRCCWCRPSTPMSPSSMCNSRTAPERCAWTVCRLRMWSRPSPHAA